MHDDEMQALTCVGGDVCRLVEGCQTKTVLWLSHSEGDVVACCSNGWCAALHRPQPPYVCAYQEYISNDMLGCA
jgi:hypothetical protein